MTEKQISELLAKYPWYEVARVAASGGAVRREVDVEKLAEESDGEIISRFLRKADYRIVAEEGDVAEEVRTEAEIGEEDDLVSEELAEIYLAQGLKCEAIEIYRKLSLLNSEKSAYFAEKIGNIEKNN
ncbi:MAG: hypothetical protein E7140_01565 [Rikenellaceae bacterium]|nr:hypothetical protein [Rikenellaceae bacterium]